MAYKAIWRTKQYSIQNNMTYKATWNTKQIIFKSGWSVCMIAALIFKTMFCLFWVQILHLLMNEDISVVIKYTLYIAHSPFECPYCEISFLLKLAKCHALFLSFLLSSFFFSLSEKLKCPIVLNWIFLLSYTNLKVGRETVFVICILLVSIEINPSVCPWFAVILKHAPDTILPVFDFSLCFYFTT